MITINTQTIEMTIENHKQAAEDGNMDVIAELDTNMEEIRKLLNKIHYMSDYKASAASELIIEAVEDIYSYIRKEW
jgi:ArsR family metal-binding transcriptional regulator